jgi:hypothetical protein
MVHVWEHQVVTKEPLPATHDAEGRCSCACRERPETGPFLEAFEHQHRLFKE